jgi:hypothetical protein
MCFFIAIHNPYSKRCHFYHCITSILCRCLEITKVDVTLPFFISQAWFIIFLTIDSGIPTSRLILELLCLCSCSLLTSDFSCLSILLRALLKMVKTNHTADNSRCIHEDMNKQMRAEVVESITLMVTSAAHALALHELNF